MKKIILFCLIGLASCKKVDIETGKPDPVKTPAYIYTATLFTNRNAESKAVKDSLIVTVNGKVIVNRNGNIPASTTITLTTGDNLKIRYNPGIVLYGSDYITEENTFEALFTGGYKNPNIKFACRCVGAYEGKIKE